jgi:hypothetical protein
MRPRQRQSEQGSRDGGGIGDSVAAWGGNVIPEGGRDGGGGSSHSPSVVVAPSPADESSSARGAVKQELKASRNSPPRQAARLLSDTTTPHRDDKIHPPVVEVVEEDWTVENHRHDDLLGTDSVGFSAHDDDQAEPRWRAGSGELEIPPTRRRFLHGREGSSGSMIVHEALVRERNDEDDDATFDDLYQVLEEIGRGGLCTVYKIRKYPEKVGGSARRSLALTRRRTASSTSFLQNLVGGSAAAQQAQAPPSDDREPSIRDAVRKELLHRHGGGNLSAPGTPTKSSGGQQQQEQQLGHGPPRRRTRNVRSMSSPSSLAMNSALWQQRADRSTLDVTAPFWTRADGTTIFAAPAAAAPPPLDGGSANHPQLVPPPQQQQQRPHQQQQRRLDVKSLRTAFKRTHLAPRNEEGGGGGTGAGTGSPEILYAVKVFNLKLLAPSQARQLKNEVEALKTLDHPSIIKAYGAFVP